MNRLFILVLLFAPGSAESADEPVTYATHIRKVFRDNCNSCHNSTRPRAGLNLTSYAAILGGSKSGDVVIAGEPEESILYLSMTHAEEPAMPPGKAPLKKEILDQVKQWIVSGLPDKPEDLATAAESVAAKKQSQSSVMTSGGKQGSPLPVDLVFSGTNGNPVTALAVSPNGSLAAVAGQLQVLLFDVEAGKLAGALPYPEGEVFLLDFSPDGEYLIAGGGTAAESGNVVVWSTSTLRRSHIVGDEYDVVLGAAISPDADLVLFGGPERVLKVASLRRGKIIDEIKKHTDWVTSASFSPEGFIFATADRDGNAYVWETQSRAALHTLRGHSGAVTSIQWTADGDHCLTASEDGSVRVWNMHTGDVVHQWQAHNEGTLSMCVNAQDKVVTSGRDGFVRQWSLEGRQESEVRPKSMATRVACGNGVVVTGDWRGAVSAWNPMTGSFVEMQVPRGMLTDDASLLLAEVSGPEAITELEVSATGQEMVAAAMGDSAALPSADAGRFADRLARAESTLVQIRRQINLRSEAIGADDTSSLLRSLVEANRIASRIAQPSDEIREAQVFLKAAIERARSAPSETIQKAGTHLRPTVGGLKEQLKAVNAELVAVASDCESIKSEYRLLESQINELTSKSSRLQTEFVSAAEGLKRLSELSAQLDLQLESSSPTEVDNQTVAN